MDTVKYLVENGVKISKYDLHQAAEMDRLEVLQYLVNTKIESGNWDSMPDDLKYALNLARNKSRTYLGSLIKQHGQYRDPTVLQGSPD